MTQEAVCDFLGQAATAGGTMLGRAVGFDVAIECGENWHAADDYANELFASAAFPIRIFSMG